MSQVLEWRELLESAHKQLQDAMTNLITNKNYSEAERRLHAVDQLMVDLIEDMGGNHQVRLMDMTWAASRLSVVSRLACAQGSQSLAALL
jgi:hypothetical protein